MPTINGGKNFDTEKKAMSLAAVGITPESIRMLAAPTDVPAKYPTIVISALIAKFFFKKSIDSQAGITKIREIMDFATHPSSKNFIQHLHILRILKNYTILF